MSDRLQQAIFAVQTNQAEQARRLLTELLQAEPGNALAWVWLSRVATTEERRRECLHQALALEPELPEVRQALLAWVGAGQEQPPAAASVAETESDDTPAMPLAANSPRDLLLKLTENLNILQEREAKYAAAAPLDLLNQIDDYRQAIHLTELALNEALPLAELQNEFRPLNLQLSTVVFVGEAKPRRAFTGVNPYRGLLKFTEDDARFFFGRSAATDSLLAMVRYLVETPTSRQVPDLLAVLGPSGSGKSSLVRAGLIPALRDGRLAGSQQWPIKVMLPGEQPLDALARVFEGEVGRDLDSIRAKLAEGGSALHELMVEALEFARKPETAIFGLVIDQFEELFTLCDDAAQRRTVIELLLQAVSLPRNRSLVVLTMRSDFYSKVAAHKPLAEAITQHQMLVSPLTEKELREAILLPAEAVGLELEKELVERLLADTRDAPGVLPLLQHALLELFNRREGNLLTVKAYDEIGGVEGALAHRANSVVGEMETDQQQTVRRIFMRLVRPGEGTVDTRRRATMGEVGAGDEVEAVVRTLADANLLITSRNPDTDAVVLDVSHEALIQKWPLLRHWLDEDREGLRIRQQLSQAAKEWEARDRNEDSLYRGAKLLEVEEWAEANPGEMNTLEKAFVEASVALRDREALERRRRTQRTFVGLGVGLVMVSIAAIVAVFFFFDAQENLEEALYQNRRAKANELAALADADSNPDRSLALSLEAAKITWNEDGYITSNTSRALQKVLSDKLIEDEVLDVWRSDSKNEFNQWVSFSPDGNQLVTAGNTVAQIWDASNGTLLSTFEGHSANLTSANFSPNGKYVITAAADGTAIIWSTTVMDPVHTFQPGGAVYYAEFAKDDNHVTSDVKLIKGQRCRLKGRCLRTDERTAGG